MRETSGRNTRQLADFSSGETDNLAASPVGSEVGLMRVLTWQGRCEGEMRGLVWKRSSTNTSGSRGGSCTSISCGVLCWGALLCSAAAPLFPILPRESSSCRRWTAKLWFRPDALCSLTMLLPGPVPSALLGLSTGPSELAG